MDLKEFKESIQNGGAAPPGSAYLQALWYDAKGDWEKSHHIIQEMNDKNAAWIHAYLHRKEGDIWNADYWYSRAGRNRPEIPLENEWEKITKAMLEE